MRRHEFYDAKLLYDKIKGAIKRAIRNQDGFVMGHRQASRVLIDPALLAKIERGALCWNLANCCGVPMFADESCDATAIIEFEANEEPTCIDFGGKSDRKDAAKNRECAEPVREWRGPDTILAIRQSAKDSPEKSDSLLQSAQKLGDWLDS